MPAIGKDLSTIRSHLGLSIQDIQHYTKIPVSTLKSIENGSILDHPEENQTYIRSFVRSYGRALKIDDDIMIKALDQNEAGNYKHLLLQEYPELIPENQAQTSQKEEAKPEFIEEEDLDTVPQDKPKKEERKESEETDSKPNQKAEKPEEKPTDASESKPEEKEEEVQSDKSKTSPSVKSVDWANVGRKFSEEKKHTPIWIVGLIIILLITAFVGYFLYENGFFNFGSLTPEEQVDRESETTQSSLSLDLEDSLSSSAAAASEETETPAQPAMELDDVLQITVYAAYDGLGPVRVWSDIKPRLDPYWLDEGTAMHFEFRDTIRVRGAYSDLILFKDGHLIENPEQQFLQEDQNYLEITRDFFTTDSKWTTTVDFELPEGISAPDSIAERPTF